MDDSLRSWSPVRYLREEGPCGGRPAPQGATGGLLSLSPQCPESFPSRKIPPNPTPLLGSGPDTGSRVADSQEPQTQAMVTGGEGQPSWTPKGGVENVCPFEENVVEGRQERD